MKRRAFSQIMAIITVSVLVLLVIIVLVIVAYVQKTNMLLDFANEQIVYTISLSQYVDNIIGTYFKFLTFQQEGKVETKLNLNSDKMMVDENGNYYYMYYQPIYTDYSTKETKSNPDLDVRLVWLEYYTKDCGSVFQKVKQHVDSMNYPKFVRKQTFKYFDTIKLEKIDNSVGINEESNITKIVPEFFLNKNVLVMLTQDGLEVVTSNYTVEIESKASVIVGRNGSSRVEIGDKEGIPFMVTRDIHAGDFLIDFRIIQMYNALLFEHLKYQTRLLDWTSRYSYVYIIPNDDEDTSTIHLFSQLINKIPAKTQGWKQLSDGAVAEYYQYGSKTITDQYVGKYGVPVVLGTAYSKVPNFDWFIYNIVFTPPYSIHPDEDYSSMSKRQYIPFTLYTPIAGLEDYDELYIGNSQWLMVDDRVVQLLLRSTNKDNYGAEVLYLMLDIMAQIKNEQLKRGFTPIITLKDIHGNIIQPFKINIGGSSSKNYYITIISPESASRYSSIIEQNVVTIPYTGLAWLTVVDSENELKEYMKGGKVNGKYASFMLYNLLFNAYMLGYYDKMVESIKEHNTATQSNMHKYVITQLTNNLQFDFRAIPYTTLIPLGGMTDKNFLQIVIGDDDFISPNLIEYYEDVDFMSTNLLKEFLYNNPNIHWSYIRWCVGELKPPKASIMMAKSGNTLKYFKDKVIYPVTPTTVVLNSPEPDFPDSIQLWWLPTTDKIENTKKQIKTDKYYWKTSLSLDKDMSVKISENKTVKLSELVGATYQLGGVKHTDKDYQVVKTMYDGLSVSRPVITNIEYRIDDVKIHYYYAPIKITADATRLTFKQSLTHKYDCYKDGTCCLQWGYDEEANSTVCRQEGDYYTTDTYGTHSKTSYVQYQFSLPYETNDKYTLKIFKDFDTGQQTILGVNFNKDIDKWTKIKAKYPSLRQYFTKYFFITSETSHEKECGCEKDNGRFTYTVNYRKVNIEREELYNVIEVAEIKMKLRITYDLYATDLKFINKYLGLWKEGNKYSSYYNVLYVMDEDGITHLSLIGDTMSMLSKGGGGYPNYYKLFNNNVKLGERYIDPNFLIGKNLYVKSKFVVEVPVKVYVITRYYYGTPPRLNTLTQSMYLINTNKYKYTVLYKDSFDITAYIHDINNYKTEATQLLPAYYFNPRRLTNFGLPIMIAPGKEPVILHKPLGIPSDVETTFSAYIGNFNPELP